MVEYVELTDYFCAIYKGDRSVEYNIFEKS